MAVSADYEIEFDGTLVCDGQNKLIMEFDPFTSPDVRSSDRPRGQEDGLFPGLDYLGAKTINLAIEVMGETEADFYTAYQSIRNVCRPTRSDKVLEFQLPGWPDALRVNARVRRVSGLNVNQAFDLAGPLVIQVQFVCADPRIYSATESSDTVGIVGVQSGRTYDLSFNRSFGGLVASNIIVAENVGNIDAPWTAQINGPVTNPSIEHVGLGKILELNADIATGDYIIVSSAPYKTIMLNGTATRYQWLVDASQWFMLEAGNNDIRFNGSSSGSPTMEFSWRSAWV